MRVLVKTIGCRANQADSGVLARSLDPAFVQAVDDPKRADVIVVNTCCVTAEAERDCRKVARRMRRENPSARVILVGCAVSGVDGFGVDLEGMELGGGGDADLSKLATELNAAAKSHGPASQDEAATTARTRALLKIQTGCEHGCAYCIVPRARGPERSMSPERVMGELRRLKDAGVNEVVLTGVQIGAYGNDEPGFPRLPELLTSAADAFAPGRVRLSSVEPWSVDDALVEAIAAHPRICPHLHVPLQAGSDSVLAIMRRGYTRDEWFKRVTRAIDRIPDLCLGTDVLCGFPGEDEAAFADTVDLLERVRPAYVHAFPYSRRPGTDAARMTGGPSREEAKERVRAVRGMAAGWTRAFHEAGHGQEREVIVEDRRSSRATGLTDNFISVELGEEAPPSGALARARLTYDRDTEKTAAHVIRLK